MIHALTIPKESCYWVRLPANARRWTRERILAGMEPYVPSTVDNLDLDWAIGPSGDVLVVACEPDRLDLFLADQPPAWALNPDGIPEHVAIPTINADQLNLLHGRHAPLKVRRAEALLQWTVIVASTAIILLLAIGTLRRQAAITARLNAAVASCAEQLTAAIPAGLGGQDPDPLIRLDQAERQTAGLSRAADGADGSGAAALATILAAWPAQLRLQVSNLAIDAHRCTIAGTAATVDDAQTVANALSTAFASHGGWRMLPLQATNAGAGTNTGVAFTCTAVRDTP